MRFLLGIVVAVVLTNGCAGCDDLGDPTNRDCGNDVREDQEVCDGDDLAGASCAGLGYGSGELACAAGCGGYIVAACDGTAGRVEDPCDDCTRDEQCSDGRCALSCDEAPWSSDTDVTFDVDVFDVSIDLAYADDPTDWAGSDLQGRLKFTGLLAWEPVFVDVPVGAESVTATLYGGPYSVDWYRGDDDHASAHLSDSFVVDGAATTFDLPAFSEIEGAVRLDDRSLSEVLDELPDDRTTGDLIFWRGETVDPIVVPIDADDTYRAALPPDDYTVLWARREPYRTSYFIDQVTVSDPEETLDFDIPAKLYEFRVDGPTAELGLSADLLPSLRLDHSGENLAWVVPGYSRWSTTIVSLDEDLVGRALVPDSRTKVIGQFDADQLSGSVELDEVDTTDDVDRVIELGVELFSVSGEILRNGARVPNSDFSGSRGLVHFDGSGPDSLTVPIDGPGPATFRAYLPAGSWDVSVAGNYWSQSLPVVPVVVEQGLVVDQPRAELSFDVPAVEFAGTVTANGELLPPSVSDDRGTLQIRREGDAVWHAVPIPPQGTAAFELVLSPGAYAFGLTNWWFGVPGDSDAPDSFLPLGEWLAGDVELGAATRRDIDVRLYAVEVGLSGSAFPAGGTLWLHDRRTQRAARVVELSPDGTSASTTVYPGHYRVSYHHDEVGTLVVDNSLVVDADQSLSYSRNTVTVRAAVTVDGDALTEPVGRLIFDRVPGDSDATTWAELDDAGRVTTELPSGHYSVYFDAEDEAGWPDNIISVAQPCDDLRIFPSDVVPDEDEN